jgi:hypothetical protein
MLGSIIKSIVTTVIITGAISTIAYFLGYDVLQTSLIVFIGIICVSIISSQIRDAIIFTNNKKLENERIKEFSRQGLEVDCAICSAKNFIPIRLDSSNTFECLECNQQNAVYINITTAQTTTPMDVNPLSISSYVDNKEQVEDKIKNG